MSKISLIIKREYSTRVKKKSFLIMTIVGPLLMAALMIAPAFLAKMDQEELKLIAVVDSSHLFHKEIAIVDTIAKDTSYEMKGYLPETKFIKFVYLKNTSLEKARKEFTQNQYYGVLYIAHNVSYVSNGVRLYSSKQPSLGIKMHITNAIEKRIQNQKLAAHKIENLDEILKQVETKISIITVKWTEDGKEEKSSTEIAMVVGIVAGFLIYFFIFMYGSQVMRGVIEEKTNRIVEVIISSVKPFELMMGKIIGVALVGLTQFLLWVIITFSIVTIAQGVLIKDSSQVLQEQVKSQDLFSTSGFQSGQVAVSDKSEAIQDIFSSIKTINFPLIIAIFLFYFIGGYLLYASLFGAIGAAVDNEADTQQFMLPVTVPLILALVMFQSVVQNPEGPLAFWFSMIPFTSPVVMMLRLPFGVPGTVSVPELIISMSILVLTFIGTTWLGAKIYRTGILMYGKKISYAEIWKWIRYRN